MFRRKNTVKWQDIAKRDDFSFECPITGSSIWIIEFIEIYGPFLETLDGRDGESYVDEFFCLNPVNNTQWVFVDSDAKLDFYDLCEEMGLNADLKCIREGTFSEQTIEVKKRGLNEKEVIAKERQRKIASAKKQISAEDRADKIRISRLASIGKLMALLKEEENEQKIKRIQEKIAKIQSQLDN